MTRRQFAKSTAVAVALASSGFSVSSSQAQPSIAPGPAEDALAGPPRGPWRRLFLDNAAIEAQADSPRTMEVQLAWSWNLINWTRPPAREQFIPRGASGEWDDGMILTARAPVIIGDRLHFYHGGCDGLHDDQRVNAAIGLATLRLDGFCSMQAGDREGFLISRREPFRIPEVTINAKTSAGGFVVAEILDRRDRVLPGFSRNDCVPFTGDSVRHILKWNTAQFPTTPKSDDWRIRFWLKNAGLYSYLPSGLDPNQPDLARFPQTGP